MSTTMQQIQMQVIPMDNGGFSVFAVATHIAGEMGIIQEQYREYISDVNDFGTFARMMLVNEIARKDNKYNV
jgi:hypothetical protein